MSCKPAAMADLFGKMVSAVLCGTDPADRKVPKQARYALSRCCARVAGETPFDERWHGISRPAFISKGGAIAWLPGKKFGRWPMGRTGVSKRLAGLSSQVKGQSDSASAGRTEEL